MAVKVKNSYDPKKKGKALNVASNDFDIAIRPYDPNAKGVYQEPLCTFQKKLYASKDYLEKHGTPQTVEDLKDHRLIGRVILRAGEDPFADANWLLKVGRPSGEPYTGFLDANSLEQEIDLAKKGKGIIAVYRELSILCDSGLINILPDVRQEVPYSFICPDSLKGDPEIMNIKDYLKSSMVALYEGI
jgi:hypothetical protein